MNRERETKILRARFHMLRISIKPTEQVQLTEQDPSTTPYVFRQAEYTNMYTYIWDKISAQFIAIQERAIMTIYKTGEIN